MLHTRVCDLFGIDYPIVQAAIWPATAPELVAAVSNAGALGSLGAVFESADSLGEQIARVRALTEGPFAVNHVIPNLNEEAFALTLEARPRIISFALGDPRNLVQRAHDAGALVMHQVHTVQQALIAAERGVDVIIAQGSEAGGQGPALGVGALALVPQVVDAVHPIPVLAAGGIADGRGLAAALVLGAAGANIGTRFLASVEASSHPDWKRAVLSANSEDVVRFEEWDVLFPRAGEGAYDVVPRVIPTPFVNEWRGRRDDAGREAERLRSDVIRALREHRAHELVAFAGQSAGMIREILTAETVVRQMIAETERALSSMASP
jgi:nitronate monooxygenase/enoyl-[acyl-carrier protein] reductase II